MTGAAVAAGTAWAVRESIPPLNEARLELNTPPTVEATSLAISPDGRTVAFVASSDGQSRLWLRELATASMRPLPGTENARLPFWSPDSRSIAFAADGQLKRVDIERGIVRIVTSGGALGGAWNRDGTILYDRFPVPRCTGSQRKAGTRKSRRSSARKRTILSRRSFCQTSVTFCSMRRAPSRACTSVSSADRTHHDDSLTHKLPHTPRQDISCSCATARCTRPTV